MVTIYLAGPMNNCSDQEVHGWRRKIIERLRALDYKFLSPTTTDFRGKEPEHISEIVEIDKKDIFSSDIVVALIDETKSQIGTAMEIAFAFLLRKKIIAIGGETNPWIVYHCDVVCKDVEELLLLSHLWLRKQEKIKCLTDLFTFH